MSTCLFNDGKLNLSYQLFPSWHGDWNGSRPSISGLRDELPSLMSKTELDSLLNLIQRPDVSEVFLGVAVR